MAFLFITTIDNIKINHSFIVLTSIVTAGICQICIVSYNLTTNDLLVVNNYAISTEVRGLADPVGKSSTDSGFRVSLK